MNATTFSPDQFETFLNYVEDRDFELIVLAPEQYQTLKRELKLRAKHDAPDDRRRTERAA